MTPFDPKAYLAANAPGDSPAFDPKAYLAANGVEGPSELESGARGLAQGATFGFADELAGGGEALLDKLKGAHEALGELYVKHRNESRSNFKKAEEANPKAYGAGQLAGGVGSTAGLALLTGGASIPEQLALGASAGGLQAAGDAPELNADTAGDIALGGLTGGAIGAAGGALGKLAGKGLNALGQKLEGAGVRGVAAAESEALARRAALEGKKTLSATGTAGAATQKANRLMEVLQNLTDAGVATPEQVQQLRALSETGVVQHLAQRQLGHVIEDLPGAAEHVEAARALAKEVVASEPERIAEGVQKDLSLEGLKDKLRPWAKRYAPRLATGLVGGALGEATGEGHGAGALGFAGGVSMGQTLGPAMHAALRQARGPALNRFAYQALQRVGQALQANPAALGKYGSVLARAAQKGPQELAAAHYALAQKSPEYQARLKKLDEEGGGALAEAP